MGREYQTDKSKFLKIISRQFENGVITVFHALRKRLNDEDKRFSEKAQAI